MKNDTEAQILEAAKKIFIQKGFAGARMQEIAEAANINKSMLHYYFRDKKSLFEKILDNTVQLVFPKLIVAIQSEGAVIEKLEKIVHTYIDTVLKNPYVPLFILHELSQNRTDFASRIKAKLNIHEVLNRFLEQISEEQQQGILKPIPPNQLLLSVLSLVIFPFIAKPIFMNILELPENQFSHLMQERKEIIMKLLKDALLQ